MLCQLALAAAGSLLFILLFCSQECAVHAICHTRDALPSWERSAGHTGLPVINSRKGVQWFDVVSSAHKTGEWPSQTKKRLCCCWALLLFSLGLAHIPSFQTFCIEARQISLIDLQLCFRKNG